MNISRPTPPPPMPMHRKGVPSMYPRICQASYEFCKDATFDNYQWELLWWPLIAQAFLVWLLYVPVNLIYCYPPPHVTMDLPDFLAGRFRKKRKGLVATLYAIDFIFSCVYVQFWMHRIWSRSVHRDERDIELFCVIFFLLQHLSRVIQDGFRWTSLWRLPQLANVFTIVPVIVAPDSETAPWLTWGCLRVIPALAAVEHFITSGYIPFLGQQDVVVQRGIVMGLRTFVMLASMGGVVLSLEILGDPAYWEENYKRIQTDMGELSVKEMVYFTITTFSTVGYGDLTPTTMTSRLFLAVAVFGGLFFFVTEVAKLLDMSERLSFGKGSYIPPIAGVRHIVVLGGEVRNPGTLLRTFNEELFAGRYFEATHLAGTAGRGWPACAYMTQDCEERVRDMNRNAPHHVQMLSRVYKGNPLEQKHLERLKILDATLTICLADADCEDKTREDHNVLIQALAIARFYPLANFALWVNLPQSKVKAVRMGFEPRRCLSIFEIKASIMAQSLLVRGWATMLTTLCLSTAIDGEDQGFTKRCMKSNRSFQDLQWVREYRYGSNMSFCRFRIHDRFVGKKFEALASEAFDLSVVVLAVTLDGDVTLNPHDHIMKHNDVVYGITPMEGNLRYLRKLEVDIDHGEVTPGLSRPPDETWEQKDEAALSADRSDPSHQNELNGDGSLERGTSLTLQTTDVAALHAEAMRTMIEKGRELSEQGGHYILILLDNYAWQQVPVFLKALQNPTLPVRPPVVIYAPPPGPSEEMFKAAYGASSDKPLNRGLMVGRPQSLRDLEQLCPHMANGIALLAGLQESAADRLTDSPSILTLTTIEGIFETKGVQGVPIMVEFNNENSVCLCPRLPRCVKPFLPPKDRYLVEGRIEEADEPYHHYPRFATGGVFLSSCLGGIIAQSYYNEGVMEVAQALALGHNPADGSAGSGQTSFPWQISLPEEFRSAEPAKTYIELAQYLLKEPWHGICLGLFRRRFEAVDSAACYTALMPPQSTPLRPTDLVIVLAGKEFGKKCHEEGLLPMLGKRNLSPPPASQ